MVVKLPVQCTACLEAGTLHFTSCCFSVPSDKSEARQHRLELNTASSFPFPPFAPGVRLPGSFHLEFVYLFVFLMSGCGEVQGSSH